MSKRLHGGHSPLKEATYKSHYGITQSHLDKKGKTNKKLKRNPEALKHLTSEGEKIIEKAKELAKEHPKGSGRRSKRRKGNAKSRYIKR